jgi:hypothetical protein
VHLFASTRDALRPASAKANRMRKRSAAWWTSILLLADGAAAVAATSRFEVVSPGAYVVASTSIVAHPPMQLK